MFGQHLQRRPRPASGAPILFDDAADRPLCEALPDLMRERNEADRVYQALPVGSAERSCDACVQE